jgi:coproporphyrinogen III oxidase-like Fe-S oxidoreductase
MAMRKEELKDYQFDTLYIGGGTPSIIDESYIAMLVVAARKNFNLAKDAEITIEINPGTITKDKVDMYKKCGINRYSVGLQTAIDSQLVELGRIHTLNQFVTCAKLLKGENFSVDIMIGLKGQTLDDKYPVIICKNGDEVVGFAMVHRRLKEWHTPGRRTFPSMSVRICVAMA